MAVGRVGYDASMPLPNAVVIGAMKCGTTALHQYLDRRPQISMAAAKELNFFTGPAQAPDVDPAEWWRHGQWHRGTAWYATQFDAASPVRGETSPGYTSPDHPEVPRRMASVLPDARLVFLVRDPVARAVSHYRHHHREGHESRPLDQALLDPCSHYLARGRYFTLLQPFLEHFPAEQLLVVVSERLRADRRGQLGRIFGHLGADPLWWHPDLDAEWHLGASGETPSEAVAAELRARVADDTEALRRFLDDELPEWS
jgi:hypothetical protein